MNHRQRSIQLIALALMAVLPALALAQADCCIVPDNGFGTATMPPAFTSGGCVYAGTTEIVDGLAPGSTIQITGWIGNFTGVSEVPGGMFGGTTSTWQGQFLMNMTGTGAMLGFNRSIILPVSTGTMDFAPRMMAAPLQTGAARLMQMQAQILSDPDFDLLRVTAGDNFGLPAPGSYQIASTFGGWGVSGYFDMWHRIDFVGAPTGALAGRSGSTTREKRFEMCPGGVVGVESSTWSGVKALYR